MPETQMLHQWVYVIVPIGKAMEPAMCAYCKICQKYFTEILAYDHNGGSRITQSKMPKWGCKKPADGVTVEGVPV